MFRREENVFLQLNLFTSLIKLTIPLPRPVVSSRLWPIRGMLQKKIHRYFKAIELREHLRGKVVFDGALIPHFNFYSINEWIYIVLERGVLFNLPFNRFSGLLHGLERWQDKNMKEALHNCFDDKLS